MGYNRLQRAFLEPQNAAHRQYEALRAYFLEGLPTADVAKRFGYTPGSFRVLCAQFRKDPSRQFFIATVRGPQASPKSDPLRDTVIQLRKQNLSVYDIRAALEREGRSLSAPAIASILKEEGFAKLPRRSADERAGVGPAAAAVADVRELHLGCQQFRTRFGGLFLFVPFLAAMPFDELVRGAGFPGTEMVPAPHALRSLLALKLFGNARHSHVMGHVFDEGLALFAGLNVIPKRSFMTEYSSRVDPASHQAFMASWFEAATGLGLERGVSFDVDFHTIPSHGDDEMMEKHYVSMRSRRQKGVLAFLAQDADKRVLCYANGTLRKDEQADEVIRFVEFWKQRTGKYPEEIVLDSRVTTYANLSRLNQLDINFITLRRRDKKLIANIDARQPSEWRQIELEGFSRKYKTPRILDERIALNGYDGELRQLVVKDLGHEEPTILITNQLRRSAPKLIRRYAQRMLIENGISDSIDFFHMDALSSAVAMKVDLDLQLTLMASSLYRLLGKRIGRGYDQARSRTIFREFVEASATVRLTREEVRVQLSKRAHNPLLIAAGFHDASAPVPWLGGRRVVFELD